VPRRSPPSALGVFFAFAFAFALAFTLVFTFTVGCANKTEEATRKAWNSALRDQSEGDKDRPGESAGKGSRDESGHRSWEEIETSIGGLAETLASGVATVDFAAVAESLCGRSTEPIEQEGRLVYNCDPEPLILLDDEPVMVEIDDSGVVSFIATNISDDESASFLEQAQARLANLCAETWTRIPADAENAHEEFYTCPMASGTVIAIGRFPRDLDANQWHFSLVVLGPG